MQVYKIPQNSGGTLHSLGAFLAVFVEGDALDRIDDRMVKIGGRSEGKNIVIVDFGEGHEFQADVSGCGAEKEYPVANCAVSNSRGATHCKGALIATPQQAGNDSIITQSTRWDRIK